MLAVFCPFAAGYYLPCFYRYVNAVIAKDLVQDFGLAPGDLELLTSAYFLAFAALQLPLGVLTRSSISSQSRETWLLEIPLIPRGPSPARRPSGSRFLARRLPGSRP
jgi:hypothetical protein